MALLTASSSSLLRPFLSEGICYPISYGKTCNSIKFPIDGRRVHDLTSTRCKSPFIGSPRFHWLRMGHDFLSKIGVAADCSDSMPDSSDYISKKSYHPLEELKDNPPARRLSSAIIAKTTVEANKNALLVFPVMIHNEQHPRISWAEFQYRVDNFGDIYFEISDDENILNEPGKDDNPVNALIGMDFPIYGNDRNPTENDIFIRDHGDEFSYDDDYIKASEFVDYNTTECIADVSFDDEDTDEPAPVNCGVSDTSKSVHPIYFSKCLAKAVNMEYERRMNFPSNGVSILGYLYPVYYKSPYWKAFYSNSFNDQRDTDSTLYMLKIAKITLHCVYGSQSKISLEEFKVAKTDKLIYSAPEMVERFNRKFPNDLKDFCKMKGLNAERAHLIGIDRLGVDVRVFSGTEVKTYRFGFKFHAFTKSMAEKQLLQLLHPESWEKKFRQLRWNQKPT